MQMLKQSRLSVSAVKPREWKFILGLAGEEEDEDETVQVEKNLVESVEGVNGMKDTEGLTVEDSVDGDAKEGAKNGEDGGGDGEGEREDEGGDRAEDGNEDADGAAGK
jgi:hypothetical protein